MSDGPSVVFPQHSAATGYVRALLQVGVDTHADPTHYLKGELTGTQLERPFNLACLVAGALTLSTEDNWHDCAHRLAAYAVDVRIIEEAALRVEIILSAAKNLVEYAVDPEIPQRLETFLTQKVTGKFLNREATPNQFSLRIMAENIPANVRRGSNER